MAVRVTARAPYNELVGARRAGNNSVALSIRVRAAPERGKANQMVIETVAAALGLAKSSIRIHSGESSRNKVLLIAGEPHVLLSLLTPRLKVMLEERK